MWFADDIFPARKDRTLAVCREIIGDDLQFSWSCLARPELVDEETLAAMKTAGCEIVFFGVESGSQRMLDAMNRMMTIKQIVAGTTAAKNAGLKIHTFMMVGFPGENYESIERTIDFLKELSPDEFSFTVAYPLPGTELFQMVQPIDDRIEWGDPSENRLIFKSNVAAWALRFAIWKAKYEFYMYRRARRGQTIFYIAHSLFKISTDTILRLAMPKETATPQFDERKVTSETTPRFPP